MRSKEMLKNEYVYAVTTKIFTMSVSILQSIIVARYLGATLKGINAYISSITSVGAIILTFGMHQAYPYFRKKYGKEKIYDDYMSVICGLYAVYILIAVIVSVFFLNSSELRVVAILIPVLAYSNIISYVSLIENPNIRNKQFTIITILDFLFVVYLYLFTKSSFALSIVILVFTDVIKAIVYSATMHAKIYFHSGQIKLIKELFKFGLFPMIALLMTSLNYRIDVIMLRKYSNIIAVSQIGVYSVGMNISDKIALIPDNLKGILVSKLAKGATESEVAKVCRYSLWSSILICIGLIILGPSFINILYGPEYHGAYEVLLICAFGTIFIGYFKLIAQYNIVHKKQIRNVVMLSISVLINILLNVLLIPRYKLSGAAFASGVGYFLSGIIFVLWFSKANNIRFSEMFILRKKDFDKIKKIVKR